MKKLFLFLFIFLTLFPINIFAKSDYIEINFTNPDYKLVFNENGEVIPFVEGYNNNNTIFERMLPRKNINVLLPPNSNLSLFEIENVELKKIEGVFNLPIGDSPQKADSNFSNENFKIDDLIIDKPISLISENNLKGFRFLSFSVYPFLYIKGELTYVKSFKLKIYYSIEEESEFIYPIDEPDMFVNYSSIYSIYSNKIEQEKYDYLIITIDSARKLIEDHKIFLETKGFKVKIVNLSSIPKTGKDVPENIRNFLKDEYKNSGFEYLLLVGSPNSIPMRYLYTNEEGDDESRIIPSDFYYADLTGDWDSNKNGKYGEPDIDKIDFYPEINVGRIPFDTEIEIKNVILKTRLYLDKSYEEYRKKVLFLGAFFNFKGEDNRWTENTDGGYINDQVYNLFLKSKGFYRKSLNELEGILPTVVENSTDDLITSDNLIKYKNNFKPGVVFWIGHGNWDATVRKIWAGDFDRNGYATQEEIKWDDFVTNSSVVEFINSEPSIFISSSCLNLYPEKDSLAKNVLRFGGAAFVGFSRISWFYPNLMYSKLEENPSMYSLNSIVLKNLSDGFSLGESVNKAIEWYYEMFYTKYTDGRKTFAHNIYALNLFGDPIIGLYSLKDVTSKPKVIKTVPSNSQSDVPINTSIKIQFDRNIDRTTVTNKNVIVQEGTTTLSGNLEYNENEFSIIFKPSSDLKKGTTYKVTIKKDIKDTQGNNLESDYTFSFKTITSQENFINLFFDKDEEYKIDLKNAQIKVENEYLTFKINSYRNWGDPAKDFTIKIYLEVDNNPDTGWTKDQNGNGEDYLVWLGTYNGDFYSDINSWSSADKQWISIEDLTSQISKNSNEAWVKIPRKYFKLNNFGYWVAIKDEINDEFDYYPNDDDPEYYAYYNLKTEPTKLTIIENYPENNSTVSSDTEIYVKFSNSLLESTITKDNFFIKKGTRLIDGEISYDNKNFILKFIPNTILESGAIYQVTVTKNIYDINGNNLNSDFVFEFETQKEIVGDYNLQFISPKGYFKTVDISKVYILSDGNNLSFKIETYEKINDILKTAFIIRMDVDNNQNTGVPVYPYGGSGEDYSIYVGGYGNKTSSFILIWNETKWEIKEEIKDFFIKQNSNYVTVNVPLSKIGNPKEINYWIGSTDDPSTFPIVDIVPDDRYFLDYSIVGKKGWVKQFDDFDEGYIYDLKSTYCMHDEANISFKIESFRGWKDALNEKIFVQINIDADQNSSTGKPTPGMGEDFLINVGYSNSENELVSELWIWEEDGWYVLETLPQYKLENNSNTIEITLPKILIGDPDIFNYWVGIGSWLSEDEFDYYPNDDDSNYYLTYDTTIKGVEDALLLVVDIPDNLITDKDTILVKGKTNPDASVKINEQEVLVSSSGFFAKVMNLTFGENNIRVKAIDSAGNSKEVIKKVKYSKEVIEIIIELFIGKKTASINGVSKEIDAPPFIKDGRTLVPIRFIAETFGALVDWDATTQSITITLDTKNIKIILQINNKTAVVNNNKVTLDVPPIIVNGRTFVPLRFIAESFGAEVLWDGDLKKITIIYKP
ncbi:MAG TPA: stalk domain-containing protein [Caldisericia bacterium]|nr:stalk domain-containing protein [Caldisericia bacterium]